MPVGVEDAARLAHASRLERVARRSGSVRGAALVLHAVGPRVEHPGLFIDPPYPRDMLDELVHHLRTRYALVRASELMIRAKAREPGEPLPVCLTFDDDLRSHADVAAAVLWSHGAVGTAFLCGATTPYWWQLVQAAIDAGTLGPKDVPGVDAELVREAVTRQPGAIGRLARDLEDLPPRSRDDVVAALSEKSGVTGVLLDREGRKRLIDSGWEVGFHTRRHDALPALDDDALLRAVGDGRDALPDTPLPSFAYPHGKATEREATAVRSAGYVVAFTGAAGVVREDTDPHMIPRMQPSWSSVASTVLALARILAA